MGTGQEITASAIVCLQTFALTTDGTEPTGVRMPHSIRIVDPAALEAHVAALTNSPA